MVIDIAAHISNLLYQNEAVSLPGLGKLFTRYKPANINHLEGVINPPSKTISFSEDVDINNELLLKKISTAHNINHHQSEIVLNDYIESIKNALSFQEEVEIPYVGKLYKDYDHQIRFIPFETNFRTASFGLPQLNYSPIITKREPVLKNIEHKIEEVTNSEITETNIIAPSENNEPRNQFKWLLWLFPIVLGVLVAFLAYKWYKNQHQNQEAIDQAQISKIDNDEHSTIDLGNKSIEQDNVLHNNEEKIKQLENMPLPNELQEQDSINKVAKTEPEKTPQQLVTHSEAPKSIVETPINRNENTCIVITGAFRNNQNLSKVERVLKQHNWKVYKDKNKGLYRIGVQFDYDNQSDKESKLNSIRKISPESWVLKK